MGHDTRGLMAMLLSASLSLAAGCDEGDSLAKGVGDEVADDINGGESEEGGEASGCARLASADACIGELGCAPVYGSSLRDQGDAGWCSESSEQFIACASTLGACPDPDKLECDNLCADFDALVCVGDHYFQASGCLPASLSACALPGELSGEC